MPNHLNRDTKQTGIGDQNIWSEYEIEAHTSLIDRPLRNLKHGDAFAVLDIVGDIGTAGRTPEGLFYRDTRYLSHFELRVEGKRPLLLGSAVLEDKAVLSVDLTNPDLELVGDQKLVRDTLLLERTKFLWSAVCYERIELKNFGRSRLRFAVDILFGSDFQDVFEVRGLTRRHRGTSFERVVLPRSVELRYEGLDRITRRCTLTFTPTPKRLLTHRATWLVDLAPTGTRISIRERCLRGERHESLR